MAADTYLAVPTEAQPNTQASSTEGTPLLIKSPDERTLEDGGKSDGSPAEDSTTYLHEAKTISQFCLPVAAMNYLRAVIQAATIFSVARLGTTELAAANLGLLSSNIMGYAIILGLVSALDTLANQASTSSSPKLTSIFAMRTYVVCCFTMPFLFLLCFNGETIFGTIVPQSDPKMRKMASDYMKVTSLGMPPLAAYECIRRYLSSLGFMVGPTLAYSIAAPLACFLCWLLVHGPEPFRIGFLGAPVAVVISYWTLLLVMFIYAYFTVPRHTWAGVSRVIFQDLGIVFRYGVAGIASTCSEWWAFEFLGLGATFLGEVTQASTAIYATTLGIVWQLPFAISISVSIRIGNLLGANFPKKAKKAATTAWVFAGVVVTLNAVILLIVKDHFGKLFSEDPAVIEQVGASMYILTIVCIFDGLQAAGTGVLKGAGLPGTAARINLMSYWILGLPVGALMTYKTRNIAALWGGLAIAVFFAALFMGIRVWKLDWRKRALEADMRNQAFDIYTRLRRVSVSSGGAATRSGEGDSIAAYRVVPGDDPPNDDSNRS